MHLGDENLMMLLTKEERLLPELEPWVKDGPLGLFLNHPLVQELTVRMDHAALVNKRYQFKVEAVKKATEAKDWNKVVYLHERPYRLEAFLEIKNKVDEQYWNLLSTVWIDSENIWQHIRAWRKLWVADVPNKQTAMDEAEQEAFADLPKTIKIYRGAKQHNIRGLSWTLDRDKALWFAKRLKREAETMFLITATAQKKDVHAHLLGCGEREIIVARYKIDDQEIVK
jgi:hypothetical protein